MISEGVNWSNHFLTLSLPLFVQGPAVRVFTPKLRKVRNRLACEVTGTLPPFHHHLELLASLLQLGDLLLLLRESRLIAQWHRGFPSVASCTRGDEVQDVVRAAVCHRSDVVYME